MKKFLNNLFIRPTEDKYLTIFRYIFFGGTVTVINIILLYVFVEFFKFNYILANIISMIICITITYILSKKFIFTKQVSIGVRKEFLSYIVIAIISIIIDTTTLHILTKKLSIYYMISKFLATFVSTATNYILKKIIYDTYKIEDISGGK